MPIPGAQDDTHAATTHEVCDCEFLGESDRVVHRDEKGRDADRDSGGGSTDRCSHRYGSGQESIVDTMVFRQHDEVEPYLISPTNLI